MVLYSAVSLSLLLASSLSLSASAFVSIYNKILPSTTCTSSCVTKDLSPLLHNNSSNRQIFHLKSSTGDDDATAPVTTGTSDEESNKEKETPKKKKKKKQQPTPVIVDIDISKLDIRVGLITKAWNHDEADKLYCEEIDVGEDSGPRNIASGLKAHYTLEDMNAGQRVLVVANLKTRKLVGFPSHGMVLCACQYNNNGDGGSDNSDDAADEKVEFVVPHPDAQVGDRVLCEGYDGAPATENQIVKKKMIQQIFPELHINDEGRAVYKEKELYTISMHEDGEEPKKLPCTSTSLTNVPIS
mmetsp:Transcript_8548/g.9959  ORF Transcript_8548/g.9959 Transcript_8548/m.9959 type:complete len:299 (+) Transcript_8548:46-942(+)